MSFVCLELGNIGHLKAETEELKKGPPMGTREAGSSLRVCHEITDSTSGGLGEDLVVPFAVGNSRTLPRPHPRSGLRLGRHVRAVRALRR